MLVQFYVPPGGYFAERYSGGMMFPALGIEYIAAVLEQHHIDVEIIPCHVLGLNLREVSRKVEQDKPEVIGITTTTENRFESFKLAEIAKTAYPPVKIVLGGPHLNKTSIDTLYNLPYIDFVVRGEGEFTMLELIKALNADVGPRGLEKIKGLSFRKEGGIFENGDRSFIENLDILSFPARHLEPWSSYKCFKKISGKGLLPMANMMTSRGCPFNCNFCATKANWGPIVRSISPFKVIDEIEYLAKYYGTKFIWFNDDTFNYNPERTAKICDLMIQRGLDINWNCSVHVDLISKNLLQKMAKAGLCELFFGIESGSERICKDIINKNVTIKQAYRVIKWCNDLGVKPGAFCIFSHPTETWGEANRTMEIIDEIQDRCEVSVAILHIYPGTRLEKRAREEDKIPRNFSWSKKDKRIITFPAAQGDVPLYVDRLSWAQICKLMARYVSVSRRRISIFNKIPHVIKNIKSLSDFKRCLILFFVYLMYKMRLSDLGRPPKAVS